MFLRQTTNKTRNASTAAGHEKAYQREAVWTCLAWGWLGSAGVAWPPEVRQPGRRKTDSDKSFATGSHGSPFIQGAGARCAQVGKSKASGIASTQLPSKLKTALPQTKTTAYTSTASWGLRF